jgi:hypothetical protein
MSLANDGGRAGKEYPPWDGSPRLYVPLANQRVARGKGDRMGKITVKSKKPLSTWVLVGVIFLLFFGIGIFRYLHGVLTENGEPSCFSIGYFLLMAAWIGTGLFLLVNNALNQRRARGLPLVDIESDPGLPEETTQSDPMQRLRNLEKLKSDGLITEEEFRRKREEMMREKW